MRVSRIRHVASACGLVAGVLGTGALAQHQAPEGPRAEVRKVVVVEEQPRGEIRLVDEEEHEQEAKRAEAGATARGEFRVQRTEVREVLPEERGYWIGLQFDPVPDALRSQLKLDENQGLVITELFPDTPAVKAGFAKHDVVVKIDDAAVTDVDALNRAVQATKGEKELALSVYRGGKLEVIKVTPAKRPGENAFTVRLAPQPGQDDVLLQWIPEGLDAEHPMRVEFYNPGVVVEKDLALRIGNLPKNLSISISKSGDEPAKVSVARGDEKWEVNEKELDKLPDDIRQYVDRMLRPGPWEARAVHVRPRVERLPRGVVKVAPPHAEEGKPTATVRSVPIPMLPGVDPAGDVHRRLDEINQRLEQLQKALEALTKQHAEEAKK